MKSGNPTDRWMRGRHLQRCLAGAGLVSTLSLTVVSFASAVLQTSPAGATTPASLNCGTLEISGTDGNTYQFNEFTTGNARGRTPTLGVPSPTAAR